MPVNETVASIKKFWADNKGHILGTALVITTTAVALQRVGLRQHDDFLKERGLYDEFYVTDEI